VTTVRHSIRVPYAFGVVLGQFFDLEHLPHVHPRTLGRAVVRALGHREVVADLYTKLAPGVEVRSRFLLTFSPPDRIGIELASGPGRGVVYGARLFADGAETRVVEELRVPGFRGLVASFFRGRIRRAMRRVWDEDLRVRMCHGGWPGLEAVGIHSTTASPPAGPPA